MDREEARRAEIAKMSPSALVETLDVAYGRAVFGGCDDLRRAAREDRAWCREEIIRRLEAAEAQRGHAGALAAALVAVADRMEDYEP